MLNFNDFRIVIFKSYDENATDIRQQDVSSLPLLRLKELTFNQGLGKLPFRVDPEELEYLQVPLSKSTKEMIEIFKNIKHLSINRVSGEDHSGLTYVMRAAWKLPELRSMFLVAIYEQL